jgi:exodeoxyribonuclease V gamma subunit
MALFLKVSNSLESLATGLSKNFSMNRAPIFEPNYIITQTEGMNNWLKLQLAAHLGIAANIRFLKPTDLIHHLYRLLNGPFTETLSRENLNWLLYQLLGEKQFIGKFPDIADYYQNDLPSKERRRMALAEKIADLFDQYQIYRPEMIREWNRTPINSVPAGEWQQYLWVKASMKVGNALPDKTMIASYILDELADQEQQEQLTNRLPAIHFFGLSIITSYHIQILFELSSYIDVHFHLLNPAPSVYWLEDRSEKQLARWRQKGMAVAGSAMGNALLTGWGGVIRTIFSQFFQHDEFLNAYEEVGIVSPEPDSLLHKIQLDIFSAATTNRQPLLAKDITDDSIHINACYTIAREVEVLYNYLVHLVDKKGAALSPMDIVVMVSDIDAYAPYIKAVFNNAPYRFPYTIADESYSAGDNIFTALTSILLLNEENCTAEEVLQLLDSSYIRKRFGISDLARIRQVVDAASIRFGIQGNKEDDTYLVSWRYGLGRIMYGICMSGGERYGHDDEALYPLDIVEGTEAFSIVRFVHFAEVLIASIEERKKNRPLADWVRYIESLVHNMIVEPGEEPDEQYSMLMRQLAGLNLANEYIDETISFEVIVHSLLQELEHAKRTSLFAGGGVTFCSLIPMRSIPFPVVAMLGLNYDKFPRREKSISFNLMERSPQKGDRNVKENDKHLFLETVLAAKAYLYLSYIGQNPNDNSELPPSALIDELIDYIEAGAEEPDMVREWLITRQPLQGFSRKYTQDDERLYSYLDHGIIPAKPLVLPDKQTEALRFEEISLDDLTRFFDNPFKTYYNKVLGIYYDNDQTLLPDTELFDLDNLQQWSLKKQVLPASGAAVLEEQLLKTGQLPLKNMGRVLLQEIEKEVAPVRNLYTNYVKDQEEQVLPLEIAIGNSLLTGTLRPVFGNNLLFVSWSKNETRYLIEAYIRYLAGAAAGLLSGVTFLSGNKLELFKGGPVSAEEATRRLTGLIAIYKEGFTNMAPWYRSFQVDADKVEGLTMESFLKIVEQSLNNFKFRCDDPYIMAEYNKGFFEDERKMPAFKAICQQIIVPLPSFYPDYFSQSSKK